MSAWSLELSLFPPYTPLCIDDRSTYTNIWKCFIFMSGTYLSELMISGSNFVKVSDKWVFPALGSCVFIQSDRSLGHRAVCWRCAEGVQLLRTRKSYVLFAVVEDGVRGCTFLDNSLALYEPFLLPSNHKQLGLVMRIPLLAFSASQTCWSNQLEMDNDDKETTALLSSFNTSVTGVLQTHQTTADNIFIYL